jgi:hypothetical protein
MFSRQSRAPQQPMHQPMQRAMGMMGAPAAQFAGAVGRMRPAIGPRAVGLLAGSLMRRNAPRHPISGPMDVYGRNQARPATMRPPVPRHFAGDEDPRLGSLGAPQLNVNPFSAYAPQVEQASRGVDPRMALLLQLLQASQGTQTPIPPPGRYGL